MDKEEKLRERLGQVAPNLDIDAMLVQARHACQHSLLLAMRFYLHLKKCETCHKALSEAVKSSEKHPFPNLCSDGRLLFIGTATQIIDSCAEFVDHYSERHGLTLDDCASCANCGEKIVTRITDALVGKSTVCPACRAFLIVTAEKKLRVMTDEEILNLDAELRTCLRKTREEYRRAKEAAA